MEANFESRSQNTLKLRAFKRRSHKVCRLQALLVELIPSCWNHYINLALMHQQMVSWHAKSTGLLRWSPICLAMVSPRACQEWNQWLLGGLAAEKCHEENKHWKDGTRKVSTTNTLGKLSCFPARNKTKVFICSPLRLTATKKEIHGDWYIVSVERLAGCILMSNNHSNCGSSQRVSTEVL